jgi:putative transposase
MPRHARLVIPNVPVHLIQRGHNRRACFFDEGDFEYYLHWLEYFAAKSGCDLHSYVLMHNHVHIAATPHARDGLARLMKSLNQRYVSYINRCQQRTGTLWEGRFKSCLILDQDYFLTCMRYIELNPVRAGMVAHPREYRWSSYRTNAEGSENSLIAPHAHYLSLGANNLERQAAYRDLVARATDDIALNLLRCATNSNLPVGDMAAMPELGDSLAHRLPPGQRGRPKKGTK